MAGQKHKKETRTVSYRDRSVKVLRNPGEVKKLSDLPDFAGAVKKRKETSAEKAQRLRNERKKNP